MKKWIEEKIGIGLEEAAGFSLGVVAIAIGMATFPRLPWTVLFWGIGVGSVSYAFLRIVKLGRAVALIFALLFAFAGGAGALLGMADLLRLR